MDVKLEEENDEEEVEEEVEAEVNLEEELIVALEELEIERKKYRKTSQKFDDANEIIITLKVQVEEMQKIIEDLEEQITTKVEYCSKLEVKITGLSLQLEEVNHKISEYHKLEEGSLKLNEMLKNQRAPNIKFGLGFEEGQTSKDANKKSEIKEEKKLVNQEQLSHTR